MLFGLNSQTIHNPARRDPRAGGLPEISRGVERSDTPGHDTTNDQHPGGVPEDARPSTPFRDPCRGRLIEGV